MQTASNEFSNRVLYRHDKRPSWGLAILAWDHDDKRAFQFEDGQLRIFKRGFYELMREVDPPADRTQHALANLDRALGRQQALASRPRDKQQLIPLSAQIAYFKEQVPEGFRGAGWNKKMRGSGAKRALKRHRDPAVELAQDKLASERLDTLLEQRQPEAVLEQLSQVLEATNLVSGARLRELRSVPQHRVMAVAHALRDLLHGDEPLVLRLDRFIHSLDTKSWELATAPLALYDPQHHLCIRPAVFKQQALWMAPRLQHSSPSGATYERYRAMCRNLLTKLVEADLHPADLLDLHDFVYMTLRPSARKQLQQSETDLAGTPEQPATAEDSGEEAAA